MLIMPLATQAASFDCDKAFYETEKTICEFAELSAADEALNLAYRQLVDALNEDDRKSLRQEQRAWLQDFFKRYDQHLLEEPHRLRNALWVLDNLEQRTRVLRERLKPGGVALLTDVQSDRVACQALLAPKHIHWHGREGDREKWQTRLLKEYYFLRWISVGGDMSVAPVDLFNDGRFSHVFNIPNSVSGGSNALILTAGDEYLLVRERLGDRTKGKGYFYDLFARMGDFSVSTDKRPFPTKTRELSSMRLDVSGSELFSQKGRVTTILVQHAGRYYVLAYTDIANAGETIAVLLQPHGNGILTPLCRHQAPRIEVQTVTEALHPEAECENLPDERSLLRQDNICSSAQLLNLPQWGGERCVIRSCARTNNGTISGTRLVIGTLNRACSSTGIGTQWNEVRRVSHVENINWQDLVHLDGTPYYVESFNDLSTRHAWAGKLYHQIRNGALESWCFVGTKAVPAAGYGY